jgi:hypothetical protein
LVTVAAPITPKFAAVPSGTGAAVAAVAAPANPAVPISKAAAATARTGEGLGVPMGPTTQAIANGAGAPQSGAARATAADGRTAARARSLRSVGSPASPAEARLNERLGRVLRQKRGPDAVITGVLCAALLFGLIGLAAHFLWIVAVIIMALGLGYTVANSRRDRVDVINQQADGRPVPAPDSAVGSRDLLPVLPSALSEARDSRIDGRAL